MKKPDIILRIPKALKDAIILDLNQEHRFAYERIGFIYGKTKFLKNGNIIIFLNDYSSIPDNQYIKDNTVGARINSAAIRNALQKVITNNVSCFHVHLHSFDEGIPSFSKTDYKDNPEIVKSLSIACKDQVHGMLIMGRDKINAEVKMQDKTSLVQVNKISVIGYPMNLSFLNKKKIKYDPSRYDRQSFLGKDSQVLISNINVGVVGLGGGGTHIVQQLAHLGVTNYSLFDFDFTDKSNLNRMVGANIHDADKKNKKLSVAKRTIKKLQPKAIINGVDDYWQNQPEILQECDIIFGCVDSFIGRRDLEQECRRNLIPYIDIGMDVHDNYKGQEPPSMAGQVILSMPDFPCMTCLGFINEIKLGKEAAKYGDVGGKPQVVWPNGILASNAVGILVDLFTGWSGLKDKITYNLYDGNTNTLMEHPKLKYIQNNCSHFPIKDVGPPVFLKL